mgnify:FL=1
MVITGRTRNAFASGARGFESLRLRLKNEAESQNAVDSRFILSFSFFVFGRQEEEKTHQNILM